MSDLTGKIVLITGAGKGSGRRLAQTFARRGALVAANDISPLNLDTVIAEITAAGGSARAYVHDVAKKVAVQAMVNDLLDDWRRIDILINCAHVEPHASLLDLDEWDLHRIFDVNTIGTLLMMQSVGRVMRSQGSGVIVNVINAQAESPVAYIASRAGIVALTQRAAAELRQHGIGVYAVACGLSEAEKAEPQYSDLTAAVQAACDGSLENGTVIHLVN